MNLWSWPYTNRLFYFEALIGQSSEKEIQFAFHSFKLTKVQILNKYN